MPVPPTGPSRLLAAIDIGSNSFRLEVGQVVGGRYRRVHYLKETVRLGAGLDAQGLLTEAAAQRGLDCLARFAQTLASLRLLAVRAVATQTLREARNRDAFLARAQRVLGHPIEVISGREEARLIYAGVAHVQPSDARRLVIDIGGRSTELILGQGLQARVAESFAVGSVSLSMRYFADGRFTAEAFRAAQVAAGAELEEALGAFEPRHWDEALGSSGTAGAVAEVLRACQLSDGTITPANLRTLILRCIEAGRVDRLTLPGLKADRGAVIGGGLSILYTLVTLFRIRALKPAKGALRQGVIVELHDRLLATRAQGHELRDDSVQALQRRFGADRAQAARVRDLALTLLQRAVPEADETTLRELRWAAELHEIGMMVSHHDHHRHSAYLVAHVDAPGFSQSQLRAVAELVLGQRGGLRKVDDLLREETRAWALLCLRLAIIKCHARAAVDRRALRLRREGNVAALSFSPAWAAAHPRTLHLLREEAAAWPRGAGVSLRLPSS